MFHCPDFCLPCAGWEAGRFLQPPVNSTNLVQHHPPYGSCSPSTSTRPPLHSTNSSFKSFCQHDQLPLSASELYLLAFGCLPTTLHRQWSLPSISSCNTKCRHKVYTTTIQKQHFCNQLTPVCFRGLSLWRLWKLS